MYSDKINKSKNPREDNVARIHLILSQQDSNIQAYAQKIQEKSRPNLTRKAIMNLPLSDIERSVLLGSLLGDGSLKVTKGYKNARFAFRHSAVQTEYFYKKVELLDRLRSKNCIQAQKETSGFGKDTYKFRFGSSALPSLTAIWELTGKNDKQIKRSWLNLLDPLAIAFWWCDDGSLVSNGQQGHFSTNSFKEDQVKIIQQWLKAEWSINTTLIWKNRKLAPKKIESCKDIPLTPSEGNNKENLISHKREPMLQTTTKQDLQNLLLLIAPYCPCESMLYKFIIRFKNTTLQQRWISLLKEKLPEGLKLKVDGALEKRLVFLQEKKLKAKTL